VVKEADWVTERSDIVTQIFFAVGSTNQVSVTSAAGEFRGSILYPDAKGLVIAAEGSLPRLEPGAPLCVEHDGPTDNYRFYTEVASTNRGTLHTILPYAAQSTDRRTGERVHVSGESGFYFRCERPAGTRAFALNDLSPTGISFVDEGDSGLAVGSTLRGDLLLPGEASIELCVEVRHMHLRRAQLVVGTRFTALSVRSSVRLAQFLAQWSRGATV
jgi:hypothetical protein